MVPIYKEIRMKKYVYPDHDYTKSWKSADGKVARWSALTTEHLVNIQNLIKSKKFAFQPTAIKACKAELERRQAMIKGKKIMSTKIITKTRHIPNAYGEPMHPKVLEVGQKIIAVLQSRRTLRTTREWLQKDVGAGSTAFTLALKTLIGFGVVERSSSGNYTIA
jgi:hypothetical protein